MVIYILTYMKARTDVRTYGVRTVDDVMSIKPNFLASMGYHIFLAMVLRARAPIFLEWFTISSETTTDKHCFNGLLFFQILDNWV